MLKCFRLKGSQGQNAGLGIIVICLNLPGYQYGKFGLHDGIERFEVFLRKGARFFGFQPQVPGGSEEAEPVEIIRRPVGRQIGAVTPDTADVLAAPAVVVVLSVDDLLPRENDLALLILDLARYRRFFPVNYIAPENQHTETDN